MTPRECGHAAVADVEKYTGKSAPHPCLRRTRQRLTFSTTHLKNAMTCQSDDQTRVKWIAAGAAMGVAGGLAEVLVVGAYSSVAGIDAAGVAGAIATAVRVDPGCAASGLAVHMTLSAALGIALLASAKASGLLRDGSASLAYAMGLLALGAIWSLNFFIVLPIVSPAFVHLLPYAVTLASKLTFAVAAVATLQAMSVGVASRKALAPVPARLTA